jgi:hypothetical protein
LQFEASLGKKVSETPILINKLGVVVYICGPSYVGGIGKRINILAGPRETPGDYIWCWGHDFSDREPTLQMQDPEFKPQYCSLLP